MGWPCTGPYSVLTVMSVQMSAAAASSAARKKLARLKIMPLTRCKRSRVCGVTAGFNLGFNLGLNEPRFNLPLTTLTRGTCKRRRGSRGSLLWISVRQKGRGGKIVYYGLSQVETRELMAGRASFTRRQRFRPVAAFVRDVSCERDERYSFRLCFCLLLHF